MQNENRHRSSCSGVEFPPNRSRDATWQYVGARVFILFHDHTTSRVCPVASPMHNELTLRGSKDIRIFAHPNDSVREQISVYPNYIPPMSI